MARSKEYTAYIQSIEWRGKTNKFLAATDRRCVLYPWKRATHSHHLHYKNLGNEQIVRDCVPLSPQAHKLIHHNIFWNLNGNSKTPSPIRFYVSNYLRISTVCLMVLKQVLR